MQSAPVHHHLLVIAKCRRDPSAANLKDSLTRFLRHFIDSIEMHVLIDPVVQRGPYGFTGIAGIVTSHIAFHYFEMGQILQFDVYSCKPYDVDAVFAELERFWDIEDASAIFISRGTSFDLQKLSYAKGTLTRLQPGEDRDVGTITR